jgi:HAD superfamily hydrolase (TIGR01509 family)
VPDQASAAEVAVPHAPKLVILDCDGVLVDSETISVAVLIDFVRKAGTDIGDEQAYRLFLGRSMAAVEDALRSEFGLRLSEAQIGGIRAETYRRFRRELKPMPGVVEALARLKARRCVASSSSLERIRLSLDLTGLLEMLSPHIYSASMVTRGKPAPDLFLHAANAMGVRPEDCVVVEDSPAGIDAARRAGMRVFAFTGGSHAGHAALERALEKLRPDRIFSDMRMLPGLVAEPLSKAGGRAG